MSIFHIAAVPWQDCIIWCVCVSVCVRARARARVCVCCTHGLVSTVSVGPTRNVKLSQMYKTLSIK